MDKYNDIINMPHHRSKSRKPLSKEARAAQFASFAALTGYEEAVDETARQTEKAPDPDENEIEILNRRLIHAVRNADRGKTVCITYFVPDPLKSGGSYVSSTGVVIQYREYERILEMDNGCKIPIEFITKVEFCSLSDTEL